MRACRAIAAPGIACIATGLLALAAAPVTVAAAPTPVLVLHSYHPGFSWTGGEQRGIEDGLREAGVEAELQVEYLDAKRHPGQVVRERLEALLAAKLAGSTLPVVVTTDNAALEFALDVRPRVFPGAAVVFCGVNGPTEAVVRGRGNVTGVVERWDPAATLQAIARMQPGVRRILVLHDQTESGLATALEVREAARELAGRFQFEYLPPEPRAATLERLAALGDDWAVLLMGYNIDSEGSVLNGVESGPLLARHSRAAVYTMEENRVGPGVVGGGMLSGHRQGEIAARLAARILGGARADSLPIVRNPGSDFRFDYQALRRFGIPEGALPPGSAVVGRPTSYYHRHPARVIGGSAFVAALLLLSMGLFANVLHRRRAEEALRASEENLRITLDSIGDAVIATDADGRVTRMNPAAEVLTGWARQEGLGRPLDELMQLTGPGGAPVESPVHSALREGRTVSLLRACSVQARNGARREVADSAAPIRDAAGRAVGAVLVFRDVTSERQLQERLRQAQRMEVVGQLAGGVAHDFNNILTAVLGAAQLLVERLPPASEDHALADEIVGAAMRATELTRQLLAFSRKGAMEMRPLRMHHVVDEAIQLLARSLDKRITIRREFTASPDTMLGDPALLQSAILNLAVNGRDAMPDGGTLTFATSVESVVAGGAGDLAPGEYLALTVRDTGVGMDDAVRARLFEPYFTTKPAGKGTGLGLASVYGCVRSHRGQIQVESAPGRGSTFRLVFPLARVREASAPPPVERVLQRGEGRVLVVDDEEIVRNTVARMLRSLGYTVQAFGDGQEAVEHFRAHRGEVDLVILDLVMPRLGGREVFHLLRGIDPEVRVIIASGFIQHQVTDELLGGGALSFIHKPVRLEDLSRLVHVALRRSSAGAAPHGA